MHFASPRGEKSGLTPTGLRLINHVGGRARPGVIPITVLMVIIGAGGCGDVAGHGHAWDGGGERAGTGHPGTDGLSRFGMWTERFFPALSYAPPGLFVFLNGTQGFASLHPGLHSRAPSGGCPGLAAGANISPEAEPNCRHFTLFSRWSSTNMILRLPE